MLFLITGGSKCGKSRIAEDIIMKYEKKRYYIATMEPFGEEAQAAIARHQSMRAGKGFETIECYRDVGRLVLKESDEMASAHEAYDPRGCVALLECMGNLCANEMFSPNGVKTGVVEKLISDIAKLYEQIEHLVIVTNQVGADGIEYPKETMQYMENLGKINTALASMADVVVEAVFGIPVVLKGEM